ncbi:DUF4142 domain-containing protein [Pseudonocardia sp. TRM90224]|uniref:DUF4142 domain-containing protein n=1 Tax=Pseudonocardia sp. TRM90224 TaxID=2812678 RepID=UPI001E63F1EB|nr:DUF4142 domain-containing protein [Pseudonocardia sp. TRM90224]
MSTRPIRQAVAGTIACLALLGAVSCANPQTAPPLPPAVPGAPAAPPAAPADAGDAQPAVLGAAGQGAAGLAALGALGASNGVGAPVRDLGSQLAEDGKALAEQMNEVAAAQGVTLGDQPSSEQQAMLADLQSRSGEQFDQAWLRAAGEALQQARDAANAVLASPDATEEAKAAARAALAKLDALGASLRQATASAGASTPAQVDAGTGGQAALGDQALTVIALLTAGAFLLGGALWRRRSI